jgi:hypothetical protein
LIFHLTRLPALACTNALGDFKQIGSDDIRAFNERVERHAGTGDKMVDIYILPDRSPTVGFITVCIAAAEIPA